MAFDSERLNALSNASPFQDWEGVVAAGKLDACRRIVCEAARRLVESAEATKPERAAIVRTAVHRLNEVDDGFICTIEREDLCDHLVAIGTAAGLSSAEIDDALDDRDW